MTIKETERDIVIKKLIKNEISVDQAQEILVLSKRQILRLKSGVQSEGSFFLIHGNKFRKPAHAIDKKIRDQVIEIVRSKYIGLSYHQIKRLLEENDNIRLSVSSVSRILRSVSIKGALDRNELGSKSKKEKEITERGLLYIGHKDLKWFGKENRKVCMSIALDVRSGKILDAALCDIENDISYIDILRRVITNFGIPRKIYYEDNSLVFSSEKLTIKDELAGRKLHLTEFGEILETLGIKYDNGIISSIKDNVKKIWNDFQDIVSYELGLKNIRNCGQGNLFSGRYIRRYNEKFVNIMHIMESYEKVPSDINIELLFSDKETINVIEDSMIYYKDKLYRIKAKDGRVASIRSGNEVTVYRLKRYKNQVVSFKGATYQMEEIQTHYKRSM